MSCQQIISDFQAYMGRNGGAPSQWYVGISKDARDRLFNDHSVNQDGDAWIFATATTSTDARQIERYFIDVVGTAGGPGGGDSASKMVYAYREASHTRP